MCASVGAPNRPAGGVGEGSWTQQWMKTYASAIADLKLDDMSIPGTHDSGTAEMVWPIQCTALTRSMGSARELKNA